MKMSATGLEHPPLSFAQERLWFLEQLRPDNPVYVVRRAFELSGPLCESSLRRSLNRIVQRHGALRTTFPSREGRPVQVVDSARKIPLPLFDLSGLPASDQKEERDRLAREQIAEPFDLENGPLMRFGLLRLGDEEHVLLLAVHHIVFDGWSLAVFQRELTVLYEAFSCGRESPLSELTVSYADYTRQQRRRLGGSRLQEKLAPWLERKDKLPPPLDLPFDRPRPTTPSFRGGVRRLTLSRELSQAVERTARNLHATLFMTLLAAFKVLLGRYARSADVTVGSPIAGRTETVQEDLIGLFAKVLVLRTKWNGDPTFEAFLAQVRRVCLEAYEHQELPFEALVAELNPARDLSRNPLFQVMFSLYSEADRPTRMGSVAIQSNELERRTARFDLTLDVLRRKEHLICALEFSSDLFQAATVDRMLAHFERIVEEIVQDPQRRLSELPSLTDAELQELLLERNPAPLASPGASFTTRFETRVQRTPDAVALVSSGERVSYADLNRRANRLARFLMAQGVGPDVRVAIALDRRPEAVVAVVAVLKAGGAFLPLDTSHPAERLAYQLIDSGTRIVIGRRGPATIEIPDDVDLIDLAEDAVRIGQCSDRDHRGETEPDQLAYVIYTSGSTGRPKGVMVTRRNLAGFLTAMDRRFRGSPQDVWLSVTSLGFDISLLELLWTLTRGSRVVLHRELRGDRTYDGRVPQTHKRLEFSLFFFASPAKDDSENKYKLLLESARWADRRRFSAVWTPERHFHEFGGIFPNPSVTGAALAAVTRRLRIRAGSVVLPLHNPLRVAEEWAVVDNLSNGRVDLSLAGGWHPNDFVFAPENYQHRKEVLVRGVETLRRLWRGERIEAEDRSGQTRTVGTFPRPIQTELSLWMTTAGNPESFRTAGELDCHLLTHLLGQDVRSLAEKIAIYRDARRRSGLDGDGHVTLMLHTFLGSDAATAKRKARVPLRRYLESSFDLLSLAAGGRPDIDVEALTAEERETLIELAVDRYIEGGGLIGSATDRLSLLNRLQTIGVDEVACLIDFGLDFDTVMAGLGELADLSDHLAVPPKRPAEAVDLGTLIDREGVTHLQCTPSFLALIEAENGSLAPLFGLRNLVVGGEVFPIGLAGRARSQLAARIDNMYGPTEATIWATAQEVEDVERSVSIGGPLANTRIYLLDESRRPVPDGFCGELCIGGDGVARGYLGRPGLTAERFVPDPFVGEAGARLYRTGDLARYRHNGELEFRGRIDDQIKIAGHRVELGEIEAALDQHPSVRESAVVAGREGQGLIAWIVPTVLGRSVPSAEADLSPNGFPDEGDGRRVYRLPNGLEVLFGSRQQAYAAYRELFKDEVYFRHGIDVDDGDCVFDVGANVGLFSLSVQRRCRLATIYAFEPAPPTFEMLKINLEKHGVEARAFPWGLADRNGEARLTHFPLMTGLSGFRVDVGHQRTLAKAMLLEHIPESEAAASITEDLERLIEDRFRSESHLCRVVTLSEVIREQAVERIDLLKIDVEGSELLVLHGIRGEDWSKIGQIVIEAHSRELLSAVSAELSRRGFEISSEHETLTAGGNGRPATEIHYLYAHNLSDQRRRRSRNPSEQPVRRPPSSDSLRRHLRRSLPEHMIPAEFRSIDRLPLTPNGKLDRGRLRTTSGSPLRKDSVYQPPGNRLERRIEDVWRALLPVERIGITDSFFDLGGNSLLLVQAMVRLRKTLDLDVSIAALFEHPTIRSLARHLKTSETDRGAVQEGRRRGELRRRLSRQSVGDQLDHAGWPRESAGTRQGNKEE